MHVVTIGLVNPGDISLEEGASTQLSVQLTGTASDVYEVELLVRGPPPLGKHAQYSCAFI